MGLREEAQRLDEETTHDVSRDSLATIVQIVPGVGGVIGSMLEHMPRDRQQRQAAFLRRLADELSFVQYRLDAEFVQSAEFEAMAEEVFEKTGRAREMEKRDYYAAALANSALPSRPDRDERERMLDVIEQLRLAQLRLLALIATTRDGAPENMYMGGVWQTIQNQWPEANEETVRMDWGGLAALNIVQDYPGATMTRQGATDLAVRMTPFGRRFHEFITSPVQDG